MTIVEMFHTIENFSDNNDKPQIYEKICPIPIRNEEKKTQNFTANFFFFTKKCSFFEKYTNNNRNLCFTIKNEFK